MTQPDDVDLEDVLQRAYQYAFSLTHDRSLAYDLVHDGYLRLKKKNIKLSVPYFFTTIRNLYIDLIRKQKVHLSWVKNESRVTNYEDTYETYPDIGKALAKLKPKHREILFMSAVEGFTAEQIATLTHLPRSTVLSSLHRTKKKLAPELRHLKELD